MGGTPDTPGRHTTAASATARGRRVRLPEHGAVAAGLGIGLACLVVDRLAGGAPAPVWAGAAVAVGHLLYRQFRAPTLSGARATDLHRRLAAHRPARGEFAAAGAAALLGGGVAAALAGRFLPAVDRLAGGALAVADGGVCLAFLGAFAIAACALDHLLVAVHREALYRTHA